VTRHGGVHPGLIGDSPKWRGVTSHPHIAASAIGRLVTMAEVADAAEFLLRNTGMNAHDLHIDGGVLIR
jgi:NAD(P)-dependent dehydrogenase (short-subunit alcohol dehydrogenase family)